MPCDDDDIETGIKGKIGELTVIGNLLRKGFQVYLPAVDMGIDFVVHTGDGRYVEVQVKSRKDPTFRVRKFQPYDNLFIICVYTSGGHMEYWTIPSKKFVDLGIPVKHKNKQYIQLNVGKPSHKTYRELQMYHNNEDSLMTKATPEVRKIIKNASETKIPWYQKRGITKAKARRYWNNWASGNSPSAREYRAKRAISLTRT